MWILLSHRIGAFTPSYNMGPGIVIKPYKLIARGESSNSYILQLYNHLGTHVDAPRHFDERGRAIADYSPEELVFSRPRLVDIPKRVDEPITRRDLEILADKLEGVDMLLIRTGIEAIRDSDVRAFACSGPYLSAEAASMIRNELTSVRALGIDSISISSPRHRAEGREAHRILLQGRDFLIVEDMNLANKPNNLKRVIISPLMVEGVDSAPCTVWAEI